MDNLIEASGVVKRYDGHTALDGVDLSIPEEHYFTVCSA